MQKYDTPKLIKEILENMALTVEDILVDQPEGSNTVWYSIKVSEPHLFTSREGEALSALNHIIRRILEPKEEMGEEVQSVLVDIGDFQKRKVENVKAIAHMMAERARYFKSNIEVDPMSAFDRRIVHEFLSNATDLKTESTGYGPTRRVIIKYTGGI